MADIDGLIDLHRDLLALSESRLPNVERLWAELEGQLDDLKKLLDKPPKNDHSRKQVTSGKIQLDGEEYSINAEFQEGTLQLADGLNIDELEAARMFLAAQEDSEMLDRPVLETAIIRFHERRQYVLECLRLVLKQSVDMESDENVRDVFKEVVNLILDTKEGPGRSGSAFSRKCFSSMADIRTWLQDLADRAQGASVLGQGQQPDFIEIMDLQRTSLTRQHESLGAITSYLVKARYSSVGDFKSLLSTVKVLSKYDNLLVHHIPTLIASVSEFGSPENNVTQDDARALHAHIQNCRENSPWTLRYFQAAVTSWWLSEYSGWYSDRPIDASQDRPNQDSEAEAEVPSKLLLEALKDGAFDFTLSIGADVKVDYWFDPAKQGLRAWLQRKSPVLTADPTPFSPYFQLLVMESLETSIDALITNMPDTLRRLKVDEEEQRSLRRTPDNDLDLEKFLLTISYAFDDRPEAAMTFWADPDSNLFGFLQWASSRQITPLASVFCEVLRTLAKGEECASAVHNFLLDEGPTASGKVRRSQSFCWDQIISELQYYCSKIRDRPALPQSTMYRAGRPSAEEAELEPEVSVMLEGYLRLISKLCHECPPARSWLLSHPTFNLVELLFQLCSNNIPARLRACALSTLESLLTDKTPSIGEFIWQFLDQWISGALTPSSDLPKPSNTVTTIWAEETKWETIATEFEDSNAFVRLLQALVAPYSTENGFNDTLPFPEYLGSAHRMPGIEPYVDLVLGRVFGMNIDELSDIIQQRILRHGCLEFIVTCLSTFNEDLLIFANGSNVSVDSAIGASSLEVYLRLHPFARVMEWLFNDKVLLSLFQAAHQDIADVTNAPPDSPLILGLMKSIEVMHLILKMQSTYLDIVKPSIKQHTNYRRPTVANTALTSFEDSILNNLQIVVDLGLYCGAGYQELATVSLKLLEKISTARKLVSVPTSTFGQRLGQNNITGVLEMNGESHRIAKALSNEMQSSGRELDQGPETPSFAIKLAILDFLNGCLEAQPDKPTVAHLLLGFTVTADAIEVSPDSPFAKDAALFHSILKIILDYPDGEDDRSFLNWLMHLKENALQVLEKLWKSPLSSVYTMTELRNHEFLFVQFLKQHVVDSNTLWDGRTVMDADFIFTESAVCFRNFLCQRASIFDYAAREICYIAQERAPSLKSRILLTLLGTTTTLDGEQIPNPTLFDLFDFIELDIPHDPPEPTLAFYADIDFGVCIQAGTSDVIFDLSRVEGLVALRQNELRKGGRIPGPAEEHQLQQEAQQLVSRLHANNQENMITSARSQTLKSWAQLLIVVLETCEFELGSKHSFILQTLQVILPKLEQYSLDSITEALEFSRLARSLLLNLKFASSSFEKGRAGDVAHDRLHQLFRVSLRAIHSPIATASLRENLYTICYRYLSGMADVVRSGTTLKQHHSQTIKASGERLIEVICDDAYAGDGTCRISAVLLLDALVQSDEQEESTYMVDALVRVNFITVLVDAIRHIPLELQQAKAQEVPLLFSYYEAELALLLRVAQTRAGATHVLNAGLFHSVRDAKLFSIDPDLGLDIGGPDALKKYHELLLALLRVINAAVLSKGYQNQQTINHARQFLTENRYQIVQIFKRQAKIGAVNIDASSDLDELVESFMVLISMTNFLEFEEETTLRKSPSKVFT